MVGLSRSSWALLIIADLILMAVDVPSILFGATSLGLALAALLIFYIVVGCASFVVFSLVEFMSGSGFGDSFVSGLFAAFLLVIPFPVASVVAFIFSSQAGYGRGHRSYLAYAMVFLLFSSPVVLAQGSFASRLSSWDFYVESVCYRIYEVSVAFTGDLLKDDVLEFCELRVVSRSNEFNTYSLLISQGSDVLVSDVERSAEALERDTRVASLVSPDVAASSVEGRMRVMRVASVSSSAVSSAGNVLSVVGSPGDSSEDISEASGSVLSIVEAGSS